MRQNPHIRERLSSTASGMKIQMEAGNLRLADCVARMPLFLSDYARGLARKILEPRLLEAAMVSGALPGECDARELRTPPWP